MKTSIASALLLNVAAGGAALAQAPEGHADNGLWLLPSGSALTDEIHFFHDAVLMPVITVITLFVLALLLWVIFRYNAKANPTPQQWSHNTVVEVVWTVIPIIILLGVALFSFDLLYKEGVMPDGRRVVARADGRNATFVFANDFPAESRRVSKPEHIQVMVRTRDGVQKLRPAEYTLSGLGEEAVTVTLASAPALGSEVIIDGGRTRVGRGDRTEIALSPSVTLKINGYQWGWSYAYPDFGDFEYASNMLPEDQTTPALYRLAVDNRVVVPVGETIRVTTTARDVIHSWALPNFGLKIDAVPGRINETWFKADREGVYYGQCSEICGVKHAFMPIEVHAVSRGAFEAWVDGQRTASGLGPMFDMKIASVGAADDQSAN